MRRVEEKHLFLGIECVPHLRRSATIRIREWEFLIMHRRYSFDWSGSNSECSGSVALSAAAPRGPPFIHITGRAPIR